MFLTVTCPWISLFSVKGHHFMLLYVSLKLQIRLQEKVTVFSVIGRFSRFQTSRDDILENKIMRMTL